LSTEKAHAGIDSEATRFPLSLVFDVVGDRTTLATQIVNHSVAVADFFANASARFRLCFFNLQWAGTRT
jgi:hypothetical protein